MPAGLVVLFVCMALCGCGGLVATSTVVVSKQLRLARVAPDTPPGRKPADAAPVTQELPSFQVKTFVLDTPAPVVPHQRIVAEPPSSAEGGAVVFAVEAQEVYM